MDKRLIIQNTQEQKNIMIGSAEIVVGVITIVGSTKLASEIEIFSGGTGTYWMAKSILEGWTVGSMFIAFGITRLTNQNKKSIKDDIVDIFMPNEVGIGENIVESATSDKWGNHNE